MLAAAVDGQKGNDTILGDGGNDDLSGSGGADILKGGAGKDTLNGGNGNDRLSGNKGDDRFVFEDKFGKDVITDFSARNRKEKIDLSDVTAITSMKDLRADHMSQKGDDVVIKVGKNNRITLEDVDMAQLDASDFIF